MTNIGLQYKLESFRCNCLLHLGDVQERGRKCMKSDMVEVPWLTMRPARTELR
jgi:hypothetical protein